MGSVPSKTALHAAGSLDSAATCLIWSLLSETIKGVLGELTMLMRQEAGE